MQIFLNEDSNSCFNVVFLPGLAINTFVVANSFCNKNYKKEIVSVCMNINRVRQCTILRMYKCGNKPEKYVPHTFPPGFVLIDGCIQ